MKSVEGKVCVVVGRIVSDREAAETILDSFANARKKGAILPWFFNQLGWGI